MTERDWLTLAIRVYGLYQVVTGLWTAFYEAGIALRIADRDPNFSGEYTLLLVIGSIVSGLLIARFPQVIVHLVMGRAESAGRPPRADTGLRARLIRSAGMSDGPLARPGGQSVILLPHDPARRHRGWRLATGRLSACA